MIDVLYLICASIFDFYKKMYKELTKDAYKLLHIMIFLSLNDIQLLIYV